MRNRSELLFYCKKFQNISLYLTSQMSKKVKAILEIDDLIKQLASGLTIQQCKLKILEMNDINISDKNKLGSIYVFVQSLNLIRKKYMNKFLLE